MILVVMIQFNTFDTFNAHCQCQRETQLKIPGFQMVQLSLTLSDL